MTDEKAQRKKKAVEDKNKTVVAAEEAMKETRVGEDRARRGPEKAKKDMTAREAGTMTGEADEVKTTMVDDATTKTG